MIASQLTPTLDESPDRLQWLLKHFPLRAHVFHTGALSCGSSFEPESGVGYLHLLQDGAVEVRDAGRPPQQLAEPSVFLYLNPERTRIEPLTDSTRILCATFEFGLGSGNPLQAALPGMQHFALSGLPGLEHMLAQLLFESNEYHCGRQSVLDRLCEIALVLVLRELMDQQRLEIGLLAGLADTRLQKALNAMHADPARDWSLAGLALVAGMSRARFAANFRNTVGLTPVGYLTQWRLGLAQSQLLAGKPLSVIASEVGYSSASALSRAFLATYKQPPGAWLETQKQLTMKSE